MSFSKMNRPNADAISRAEQIIVALDYPNAASAYTLLDQLSGIPCVLKVGMQLFYAEGPALIRKLKQQGFKVFLDLKLHDIPNTVRGAAESVTQLGVDMLTLHASGGKQMMQAALEGVERGMEQLDHAVAPPAVIAVTQLTSTSQAMLNDEIGIAGSVEASVLKYAELAQSAGLQGVVASPHEVQGIKQRCGSSFLTVTPGIRPAGAELGDQSRVMTPEQAFAAGTDFIVIGRPITAAADPRQAINQIIGGVD